jgi:RhtB (resistance to homoserine/threonine) family protein
MAVRNTLAYSRRTGVWTAVGFGAGNAVHIGYCLAGLALLISRSSLLFDAIRLLGAAYLVYLGIRSLFAKAGGLEIGEPVKRADISPWAALRMGFLTNILNPKATLFFLSLFTSVIAPDTPAPVLGILAVILIGNTILWFSLVAVFLTRPRVREALGRSQNILDRTLGGLLIALGVKVALIQR